MKKQTFTVLVLAGLIGGCTQHEKEKSDLVTEKSQDVQASRETHHHNGDNIELNNGVKWKVVPEMMKYIRDMETETSDFFSKETRSMIDYTTFGGHLRKKIDTLTSNCTMEGKAHDELHKWLVPYIDLVDNLNQSKNTDEAATAAEKIKNSFQTMNTYFE